MPVGNDNKIQLREVYANRSDVVFKCRSIVSRVEQNPLSIVLNESGEAPVLDDLF